MSDTVLSPVRPPDNSQPYTVDAGQEVSIGSPVTYSSSPDKVKGARANALATSLVLGVSLGNGVAGTRIFARNSGIVEASAAQWAAVIEGGGGLVAGDAYYLSAATAGKITTVAPSGSGDTDVLIGVAVSDTELNLMIQVMPPTPIIP